jgi:uncharacterized protein YuzE
MRIHYDAKTDLLYLRLDDETQPVVNRRVSEDIVLDIGADERLVGIEILDASRHVRMEKVLPVTYDAATTATGGVGMVREKRDPPK